MPVGVRSKIAFAVGVALTTGTVAFATSAGSAAPGQDTLVVDRSFEIANVGANDCLVTSARIVPGSDPEFSLPDGDLKGKAGLALLDFAGRFTIRPCMQPGEQGCENGETRRTSEVAQTQIILGARFPASVAHAGSGSLVGMVRRT